MGQPTKGEMIRRYMRFGRVDLAQTKSGWWATIWRCPPPDAPAFRVLDDEWRFTSGRLPVRIIRKVEVS